MLADALSNTADKEKKALVAAYELVGLELLKPLQSLGAEWRESHNYAEYKG